MRPQRSSRPKTDERNKLLARELPLDFPGCEALQVQVKLAHAVHADLGEPELDLELHLGSVDDVSAHRTGFARAVSAPQAERPIARQDPRIQRRACPQA